MASSKAEKIKFHNKVKRFYHKDLFRKIYTVVIIGLVAINSVMQYVVFAGDVNTYGADHNDDWGGGGDTAEIGYDSGNDRSERQGPCPDGWHVPSRGEWQDIVVARCHYRSGYCSDSGLSHDSYGNFTYTAYMDYFGADLGMPFNFYRYWSSSPSDDRNAWIFRVHDSLFFEEYDRIDPFDAKIRCLKDSIDNADPSESSITPTSEGYVITDNGKSYTLALEDLEGTYYRGVNENKNNSTWVNPSLGYGYGYGYGQHEACTITVDGNEYSVNYGESYSDSSSDYLYPEENSNCSSQTVSCDIEGNYLGEWYTNCEEQSNGYGGNGYGYGYGYGYGSSYSSCHYNDIDGNQQELSHGSSMDLFSSNLVSSEDSCHSYKNNYTCDDGTFKLDGNEYSETLYDYCEEEGRNTAELATNEDGSKTITYDCKSYTVASGDLDGTYYRGVNENTDRSKWGSTHGVFYTGTMLYGNTNGVDNAWGGGNDTAANGYDSGNPRSERQGPCEEGWHIPSRGEWEKIREAWCHYSDDCDGYPYSKTGLGQAFRSDFGMTNEEGYWSSTPQTGNLFDFAIVFRPVTNAIITNNGAQRKAPSPKVRCLKDSIDDVDSSVSSLTTTSEGYVLKADGKSYTIASGDLDGYYYRGFNENKAHSKWLSTDGISPYTGTMLYGNTYGLNNVWGGSGDTAENGFDSGNSRSERQGPCEDGWHVPSRGERNAITTAWCHLSSNDCISSDLHPAYDWTSDNNLIYIENHNKHYLSSLFYSDFGISSSHGYWSSSPRPDNDALAWRFYTISDGRINPDSSANRDIVGYVRCIKDTVDQPTCNAGCDEGYDEVNGECINEQMVACTQSGAPAEHAHYTPGNVKITYDGSTWSTAGNCAWNCDNGYDEVNEECINEQMVACTQSGAPAEHAHYTPGNVKITYDGSTWSTAGNCAWSCDEGFREEGNACVEELTVTLNAAQNGGTIDGQDTKTLTVTSGSTFDSSNYTGNKDDYTFVGWAETSGTTGVLALDPIITSDKTLYAVFKKDVTGTFGHDATVSSVTPSSISCTLWNKAEDCTLTAPTINCAAGYGNGVWSPSSMTITQNTNFTASCSDTQTPNISITKQPSVSCVSSDGVRANITDNVGVTSMKYAIIDSSSCNSETVATWIDYVNESTIPFSSEESNDKYVCFKASDAAGNTSYESTSQITNIDTQGPGEPTLGSPTNDVYTNDNTPTFSWSAGEMGGCATLSGYTIQICSDSSCTNIIQTSSPTTASFTPNAVLVDGIYYWRVKETDSLNRDSDFTASRILKIDTTAPVLTSRTTFENVWYTENQISEFTYTDTGAGINGTNKITCEINQEGNASKCTITNVEICDNVGNCNREDQISNTIKLDRTQPVCGTWTYSPTAQTNNNVTATLAGSTDATSGIKTAGGTCSLSSNDATCDVIIEDNAGHTRVCTSASVNNIDKVKPEGEIQAVTSTLKSASQTAKLICSDNVGVTSYYWGTNSNPASTDYQNITSQTNYETTKTVNAAGTYYLFCKDVAGTVSDSKSQVYNSYEVHNMLNVVDKDESIYNTTNYTQTGSTVTYIAPAGTMITFANVYTIPTYSSANMYKGYTTTASGTPDTSASVTLNGNSTYYFWFYRTKYDLNLVKNNGIEIIYYKVNGATSYSGTSDSKSVSIKAGSDVYVYAVANSGYTYTQTSATNPQSFSSVTGNKTFSPTTLLEEYTITYNNLKGVDNPNPTTFTVETPTINLTNLTKNGYSFDGWYNAENNGTKVTQILQGTHDNLVLYAHWITNEYSIQYNNVEGSDNAEKNPITGFTVETPTISLNDITKNKYIFSGWYTDPQFVSGSKILEIAQGTYDNVVLYAKWLEDFNSNGIDDNTESHFNIVFTGGEIGVLSGRLEYQNILVGLTFQEVGIIVPEILARSGYVSKGWSPNTPQSSDIISNNVTYSVIWKVDSNNNGIADEEEPKPSYSGGGGGGGGGGGKKKSESEDHGSAVEKEVEKVSQEKDSQEDKGREESDSNIDNDSDIDNDSKGKNVENEVSQTSDLLPQKQDNSTSSNSSYTEEQVEAYTFAKANGITTTSSIEEAKMNTPLTRIQMAKMLSNFAINVLGKEPDYSKGTVKFRDVSTKMDRQYDGAVTKSYVLGIMGQNMKNNEFRPNDEVTRAEFVTSLSRLLYSTEDGEYKSTKRYYEPHIEKLKEEGIISKVDPSMKEKRGYVMLMLMRSSKK